MDDAPDLSPREANDSAAARAVRQAFSDAGFREPRKVLYLDAVRMVRRYRWRDPGMLARVARREVGHIVDRAREAGLEIEG